MSLFKILKEKRVISNSTVKELFSHLGVKDENIKIKGKKVIIHVRKIPNKYIKKNTESMEILLNQGYKKVLITTKRK